MFSIDDEAGDSPKTKRGVTGREGLVVTAFVDARKLFPETVLTPAYGFTVRVDQDSVRASLLDELSFFQAIPQGTLRARMQPLVSWQCARPVKMHALTMVPAIFLREEFLKIRPG